MKFFKIMQNQKGITLIEVMIAMVILGFGLLTVVALQTSNMRHNASSKRQTEGYNWIMDKIERLLVEDYNTSADLTVADGHTPDSADADMIAPYTMEWNVVNSADITNAKEVSVFIRWNGREVANVNFMRTETSF